MSGGGAPTLAGTHCRAVASSLATPVMARPILARRIATAFEEASVGITSTHVCALCVLTAATIRLYLSEVPFHCCQLIKILAIHAPEYKKKFPVGHAPRPL